MMKIELWPVDRPVPYAKNPRKIPQSAVEEGRREHQGNLAGASP